MGIFAGPGDTLSGFTAQLIGGPFDLTAVRGQPIFQDQFQQSDGYDLSTSPNWNATAGQWQITGGQAEVNPSSSSTQAKAVTKTLWTGTPPTSVIVEADVRLKNVPSSGPTNAGLLARYTNGSQGESYYAGEIYLDPSNNTILHVKLLKYYNGQSVWPPPPDQSLTLSFTGGPRHLRLEVTDETIGNGAIVTRISLYVDSTLAVSYWDSSSQRPTGVQAGILGDIVQVSVQGGGTQLAPGWSFANFQVRTGDTFASDNFSRLDAVTDNQLDPAWVPQSGSFTVNGANQAVGSSTLNPGTYNVATVSGSAPVNVSVSATVTLANSSSRRAGLVARFQDSGTTTPPPLSTMAAPTTLESTATSTAWKRSWRPPPCPVSTAPPRSTCASRCWGVRWRCTSTQA
jgi:hypothetical protein